MAERMRWDRAYDRVRSRAAGRESFELNHPVPRWEMPKPVYQFELPCGLILGLVEVGGETRYGRYDRTAGGWRLRMSDWMRDEIDAELDRLDREAAEADEP